MTPSIIRRALELPERLAIVSETGSFTYGEVGTASHRVANRLMTLAPDLEEARVAFLVPPGFEWVVILLGIWRAGGIAVPLSPLHPSTELEQLITDSDARLLIVHPQYEARMRSLAVQTHRWMTTTELLLAERPLRNRGGLPSIEPERRAMILYTSGTTGRPKGVVMTHANLQAQIETLVQAWGWGRDDRTLLVLPLHHVHGIVNVLLCALWAGACCEIPRRFNTVEVWNRFAEDSLTVFMAVPTIYVRLIAAWRTAKADVQARWALGASRLRLTVSGSAALPVDVLKAWREITGQTLLERYGMTEVGMALSNPLTGERRAGTVGLPLPGVEVRLVGEDDEVVDDGGEGQIEIRGPNVFHEYWRLPEATREVFRGDWFLTGDVAVVEHGYYRILGRNSVDIIKTGGYKVSALEIEEALRVHPAIQDCAVVGVPDPEWGERVAAALVPVEGLRTPDLRDLREWARDRLAVYKIPSLVVVETDLPRNVLGKVTKSEVRELFVAP